MMTMMLAAAAFNAAEFTTGEFDAVFNRAQEGYRTILSAMAKEDPKRLPKRYTDGRYVMEAPPGWCVGFFPGSLWYLYEATGDAQWRRAASEWTERLIEPLRHDASNHDVGFRTYCSAGNALRLTGEKRYADFLHDTAAALRTRFDDSLGLICSWDSPADTPRGFFAPQYVVIIDNMMNLELLEWDAKNGGSAKSDVIARSQADSTDRHHFRPDGSAYHVLSYNRKYPGRVSAVYAGQGANTEGTWARGQSWAIYGFTMMYRETKDRRYLERAERAAEYWMNEPNLPSDRVPYWDFSAVGEERDASAAAITASALVELSQLEPDPARALKFRNFAVMTLRSLASPAYFHPEQTGGFLIDHSVGSRPSGGEVDVTLNYADYYFLEALVRLRKAQRTAPVKLEKQGTYDLFIVESNPIVFKNRLWLFEYIRWERPDKRYRFNETGNSYFRFRDYEDLKTVTPSFAPGLHMGNAFVEGDTVYVTAGEKWGCSRFYIMESKDLEHWSEPRLILENPVWQGYNTTMCKAGDRYILSFELGKPEKEVGEAFTMFFAESTDLKTFRVIEGAKMGADRYTGAPMLRWFEGWFYYFHLEGTYETGFQTRVARSRDLKSWEFSPHIVLDYTPEDKQIHPRADFTDAEKAYIAGAKDVNASDLDMCDWKGRLRCFYSWGNQRGNEFTARAEAACTEKEFCESFFK